KLNGGGTWDAGEIKLNGLAGITIAAGTTVTNTTASGNFAINPPDATAAGGSVTIQGTFVKDGPNTTTFGRSISLVHSGLMDIRAGSVVITAPVFSAGGGDYTLAAGATLQVPSVDIRGALGNKGVLQGEGTLIGSVNLTAGGRVRGGTTAPGVLTIGGNAYVNVTGDSADPPRFVVAAVRTGPGVANAGRIDVTGTGVINFNTGSNGQV